MSSTPPNNALKPTPESLAALARLGSDDGVAWLQPLDLAANMHTIRKAADSDLDTVFSLARDFPA